MVEFALFDDILDDAVGLRTNTGDVVIDTEGVVSQDGTLDIFWRGWNR
jgi:hypothetical protein